MRTVACADDWLVEIEALGVDPWARRTVIVGHPRVAHALRKELARGYRGDLLVGTCFLTLGQLAREILRRNGSSHGKIPRDATRPAHLRAVFERPLALAELDRAALVEDEGWDRACARAIADLDACDLLQAEDDLARDLALLERSIDSAAESRAALLRAAAARVRASPALAPEPTLVVATGHESLAEVELVRALRAARVAITRARPRTREWLERIEALWGREAREAADRDESPFESRSARDYLARYLFAPPEILASSTRDRASPDDETARLEEHAGVGDELDAAARWVVARIARDGLALDEIAVAAPFADPWLSLLAERLSGLDVPSSVAEGLPFVAHPDGAKIACLLAALRAHLCRDAFVSLLPMMRASDGEPISPSIAVAIGSSLATLGGSEQAPRAALEWSERWAAARVEGAPLEARLRALEQAVRALVDLAREVIDDAPLSSLAARVLDFAREHLQLAHAGSSLASLEAHLTAHLDVPLRGPRALRLLQDLVARHRTRAEPGAGVALGTPRSLQGLSFRAVRVIGLAEGTLPCAPRPDPVLPDARRRALSLLLPTSTLQVLEDAQALHRLITDCREQVVLSCSRQTLDGSQREPSSMFVDAAAALGAHPGSLVPSRSTLEAHYFRRSRERHEVSHEVPYDTRSLLRAVARGRAGRPASWSHGSLLAPALDGLGRVREPRVALPRAPTLRRVPGTSAERAISASRLSTLLTCPRWFFFESVLGWREPPELPPTGGLDPRTYGTLFHRLVERLAPPEGTTLEAWIARADRIAAEELAVFFAAYAVSDPAVIEQTLLTARADLGSWLEHEWRHASGRRFVGAERKFGFDSPVALDVAGAPLHVHGIIDRLDVEAGRLLVRDFKTGRAKPRDRRGPDPAIDLQLALYARVATILSDEWGTPRSVAVAYVYPRSPAQMERAYVDDYDVLERAAGEWLALASSLLRAASFPRTPRASDCAYCPFVPVCGPRREPTGDPDPAAPDPAARSFQAWKAERD